MSVPKESKANASALRNQAEAALARHPPAAAARPAEDLLHELQVHQIELETQNEALREAQIALEASCDRYVDLYEFAPVGYLTLSGGMIAEINRTGARLLRADRASLLNRRFSTLVVADDADRWHRHLSLISRGGAPGPVELLMRRGDGTAFHAQIDAVLPEGPASDATVRLVVSDISHRKAAEAALRDSEAFSRAILDSVAAEVAVLDRNGVIIAVNQPWRAFALENGIVPGQPVPNTRIGDNYLAVCRSSTGPAPDEADSAAKGIRAVLDGRLPAFRLEYPCHSPQQQRWFSMSVTPLEGGGGVVVAHTDISERKAAEAKLRQLSLAVEQTSNSVIITDLEGNIEYINAAFATTSGYSVEEVLGRNPKLLQSGLTPKETFEDMWRTLGKGEIWRGEFINRRKNGETYSESEIISPVRQADGRVTHYIGIRADLTESKQNELLQQQALRRWSLAADSAGIGVWEWDMVADRVKRDDRVCRIYGLEPGRFEGGVEAWREHVHPDDVEAVSRDLAEAIQRGGAFEAEFRVVWPDGTVRILKDSGIIVRNAEGKPVEMIGISQDITRRRRAEDAFHRTAQRVKRLSGRVLEVQEAERRRIANELHDELGQTLTAIKLSLLAPTRHADGSAAASNAETVAIVEEALQQVRRLTRALRPAVLDDLGLAPALRWLAEQAEARGDLVVTFQAPELQSRLAPEIETACFRIVQEALTNVARHARAHLVEIDLHVEAGAWILRVRDDGCGFDPAGMRERAMAGNSMGLLGMEERAALIGGQLAIESAPGQGSTVTLRFLSHPPEETT